MRKFLVLFLALGSPLIFSSCGNFKQKFGRLNSNQLQFTVANRSSIGNSAWSGVAQQFMLYIIETSGTGFSAATPIVLGSNSNSATATIIVPNGTYKGYALAWNSSDLSGDVGCWRSDGADKPISGGGTENVSITIGGTTSKCDYNSASGPFGPSTYATTANFFPLTIHACQGATPTVGSACGPGTASTTYNSGSVRVVLDGYVKIGGAYFPPQSGPQHLTGACVNLSSGSSSTSPWVIPVGNTSGFDKFISTTIYFYSSPGCTGTQRIIGFSDGLLNGSPDGGSTMINANQIAINVGS